MGVNRLSIANEKLSNLICNWQIHFSGLNDVLTVDQFIYRVNTLTSLHLHGNFNILCQRVHSLFEGKALQWFWRYRQQCVNLTWFDLWEAMRRQFKDFATDSEIRDDIRRRKQRPNETFDDFLDAVMTMCDRLRCQMSDSELVETLTRNLKSDSRHELLHLQIEDIASLRREARRHEKFFRDFQFSGQKSNQPRRQIYQISHDSECSPIGNVQERDVTGEVDAIDVGKLKCWNCEQIGHRYQDCLKARRIFWYGCGAPDTLKPTCTKCSAMPENTLKDVHRTKDGHPVVKNRNMN